MAVLAFTTSVDRGSLCLYHEGKLVEKKWNRSKSHSEILTFQISQTLKKLSLTVRDIEALIFDNGPGSFTGCRVSAGVAKTLAYSLDLPLYTATSLSCMSYLYKQTDGEILAILDAHRNYFYFQKFHSTNGPLESLTEVQVSTLDQLNTISANSNLIVSCLADGVSVKGKKNWPQAKVLIEMYLDKSPLINRENWTQGEPLYVRAPAAVENLVKS